MRRLAKLPLPIVAACALVLALSAVAFANGGNHHKPGKGGGHTGKGAVVVTEHATTDATTDTGAPATAPATS